MPSWQRIALHSPSVRLARGGPGSLREFRAIASNYDCSVGPGMREDLGVFSASTQADFWIGEYLETAD